MADATAGAGVTPSPQDGADRSIGGVLGRLAAADPQAPAVTTARGATLTRAELESRSNRLARAYQALGVRPGSFVSLALPNGAESLVSLVAVWKAGATPQPLSHRLPERELTALVELADPALVVGLDVAGRRCVPVGFTPSPEVSDAPLPPVVAPSLKAPTSGGSTGRPKLIVATDPATVDPLLGFGEVFRLPPSGVVLCTGPLSHNGPLLTCAAALVRGLHVVVVERFDAREALELVAHHHVRWMYTVPTMLRRIAELPPEVRGPIDVSSLRTVITMAAHCPESLRRFCLDYLGPDVMLELYAATEAQAITTIDGHGWIAHPGSVGRPVVGEIRVRRADGSAADVDEVGELWMRRGEGLPTPYRYVGATAQRSEDGWESVGDLGRLDAAGHLHLADRRSDLVVVGGANVYPAEVEAALEEHPSVSAACVVGLPDAEYGQTVHAVLNVVDAVTADEVIAHVRARLVAYKAPRTVECVVEPLRDEAGKTRRSRVRAAALARLQPGTDADPSRPGART